MENNMLFLTVLRTLGYNVYPTGARVNTAVQFNADSGEGRKFMGWYVVPVLPVLISSTNDAPVKARRI
jgi:hypothetical protein